MHMNTHLLIVFLAFGAAFSKNVGVGEFEKYSTIQEAILSELPLTEDLRIYAQVPAEGYQVPPGGFDTEQLSLDGHSIEIHGVLVSLKTNGKTVYIDDDVVFEIGDDGGVDNHYLNILGADGIEGRITLSGSGLEGFYYMKDHLGSVVGTIATGTVIESDIYSAFGSANNIVISANSTKEKYTGKELDKELGLSYFGARYYDQDIGIWISPDAAHQFASPYAYSPDPINSIDPDGNEDIQMNANTGDIEQFNWVLIEPRYSINYGENVTGQSMVGRVSAEGFAQAWMNTFHPFVPTEAGLEPASGPYEFYSGIKAIGGLFSLARDAVSVLQSGKGLLTPAKYFGRLTKAEAEAALDLKYGPARSIRSDATTFYNSRTFRSYNVHQAPGHQGGLPHVDIRTRGVEGERKFFLQ